MIARLDAITSARAAAAERNAQLLSDIRQRLEGIAADPGVSATALQEELAVEEAAAQREAVAAHQVAAVAGVEAAFAGTAAIMARYDAAGPTTPSPRRSCRSTSGELVFQASGGAQCR